MYTGVHSIYLEIPTASIPQYQVYQMIL